jgi:hypothetical protein
MASGVAAFGEDEREKRKGEGSEILTRTSARRNKLCHVFNKNCKQEEGDIAI